MIPSEQEADTDEFRPGLGIIKVENPDILPVQVILRHYALPSEAISLNLQIHRERDVVDIINRVQQWIENALTAIPHSGFRLLFKNRFLEES